MTAIIANSALLLAADVVLALAIALNPRVRAAFGKMINLILAGKDGLAMPSSQKMRRDDSRGMNLFDRFELSFIIKPNIRRYIPFMNGYVLALAVTAVFFLAFIRIYGLVSHLPSAAAISCAISAAPLLMLDVLARYNSEATRKKLSDFISVLNRWCAVKEDIMYAFEKSLGSGIGEPLETFVRDMVVQVNCGMDCQDALDILRMKIGEPQFDDFILNVKQNLKHRGNIVKLLANLENQFYRIDEEYNRRRISTYRDRMIISFIIIGVPAAAFFFIRHSARVADFYLGSDGGRFLLTVFSGMYMIGLYLAARITKFKI